MTEAEKRFQVFGKMFLHVLLEEPLRLLDMNRAGTKNMFMTSHMRQKLTELSDDQFELMRDVFIHLTSDAMTHLVGHLLSDRDKEVRPYNFYETPETAEHAIRATVDGETVRFPGKYEFADIAVNQWLEESAVRPTSREIAGKYGEHEGEYRTERMSYAPEAPNASQLAVEKFGKLVIECFKDNAVDTFEWFLTDRGAPDLNRVLSARIKDIPDETKDALRDCVIQSVMTGVHDFLHGLEVAQDFGEGIEVTVDGINIVQASDGLNYEIFGEDGFDAKFSNYPTGDAIEEKYREDIKALKRSQQKRR